MRERAAFVVLWLCGICVAVWLEVRCYWRAGTLGASFLPGVIWWTIRTAWEREAGWWALFMVPATGVFWAGTAHAGSAAFGFAVAAAAIPSVLIAGAPGGSSPMGVIWRAFAGSGFIAAGSSLIIWCVEWVSGAIVCTPTVSEAVSWVLSTLGSGLLAVVLLSAGSFTGLGTRRHVTTGFHLEIVGYRERMTADRLEAGD